ncbi:GerMN domain-containing protein [bacterium]|nr:GerMN domain-containing protein [bacterium]
MARSQRVALTALALTLALGAGLVAFWRQGSPAERAPAREVTLYYLDPQAMFLVPVSRKLPLPQAPDRALQAALDRLVSDVPPGLAPALPPSTQASVSGLKDGKAGVTLRLKGPAPGSGGEQLMAAAVVRTAGALDGIQEVALALEGPDGKPLASEHLDLSQPFSPTDPGMENLYLEGGSGLAVTVYYRLPNAPYLVPIRVPLPAAYQHEPLKGSFALLLDGPPPALSAFLAPSLPSPRAWRWNGLEDGNARILWKGSEPPQPLAVRALALTLTERGGIQAVRIDGEAGPLSTKVGPFDLGRPIPRPEAINPLDDKVSAFRAPGMSVGIAG